MGWRKLLRLDRAQDLWPSPAPICCVCQSKWLVSPLGGWLLPQRAQQHSGEWHLPGKAWQEESSTARPALKPQTGISPAKGQEWAGEQPQHPGRTGLSPSLGDKGLKGVKCVRVQHLARGCVKGQGHSGDFLPMSPSASPKLPALFKRVTVRAESLRAPERRVKPHQLQGVEGFCGRCDLPGGCGAVSG